MPPVEPLGTARAESTLNSKGRPTMSKLESIAFSLIAGCAGLMTIATIVPIA
jgi:hypothetical protein